MEKVRTRFAPSPTGTPESIHLGFVIRALWNYAYARKNNGQFILRIEDTDQKRSRKDTEKAIYEVLKKFNIHWDEGPDVGGPFAPYRQSERLSKYREAAEKLVEKGFAYYDFDAAIREKEVIKANYQSKEKLAALKERPKARHVSLEKSLERVKKGDPYVIRIKIPEDRVFEYDDWILKKRVRFYGKEVPDMILLKSDGFPTYHLAVVVDDIDMQITHVFRGQEWITSTPIHLFVYEGLEYKLPQIGHFSVILDPRTKKKFSKRDLTALFGVNTWLCQGYLPEAILNYLMLLGWAPKDNREIFTLDEFVEAFDREGVQKANPTFDMAKLDWMNSQYIQKLSDEEFVKRIKPFAPEKVDEKILTKTAGLIKTRIKKLSEFGNFAGFFFIKPKIEKEILGKNWKDHLSEASRTLTQINEWKLDNINEALMSLIKEKDFKTGDFFMDLRIAITGNKFTPPINESMEILGKEETLKRIKTIDD
jgi:glutamyl-tRNA synthetase